MYTIHATNSGDNFITMSDLKLLMYVLYGTIITQENVKEYCRWQEQSPYDMNVINDEDYLVAEAGRLESAPSWMRQMYKLTTKGLGTVPAISFSSHQPVQSTQERWNALQLIPGLSDTQRARVLLHFNRLYAVKRSSVVGKVSYDKTCKECGCDYRTTNAHQHFCYTCDQNYMRELAEDSETATEYQAPTLSTQPLDNLSF